MADPVKKPLTWSKAYPVYAEKHDMYRVFQELLKELIINKPGDPLLYIRDELPNISRLLHSPRVFLLGPNIVAQGIGRNLAAKCGARFLTLAEIIEASPSAVKDVLSEITSSETGKKFDENVKKLLVSTIKQRLAQPDCQLNGYILYGFPQNDWQAKAAQQNGLLAREVYILLPDPAQISSTTTSSKPTKTDSDNTKEKVDTLMPPTGETHRHHSEATMTKSQNSLPEMKIAQMREVADSYDLDMCKVIPYEKWSVTKKQDIEGELLSSIVSLKPCGSPFIPRILIIGPPSSGRSTVADALSERFQFVNVDLVELIRGTASFEDDVGKACKSYLENLQPMKDDLLKKLLQRRLFMLDCQNKGWILHGFPDTAKQLQILDSLQITPNRVFFLYCPEEVAATRLQEKRGEIFKRRLPGSDSKDAPPVDESNFEKFPYGKSSFRTRFDTFAANLTDISGYYGSKMIYVDATQKMQTVIKFALEAVLRPPVIRFPDPTIFRMSKIF